MANGPVLLSATVNAQSEILLIRYLRQQARLDEKVCGTVRFYYISHYSEIL
ncbi:hypothetical protein CI610_00334 [invertebrate metagenome]|uniref:Uncharacterized protein n=1 Tax=invertebrate metagenome TaxID=1711999 RepID=A0A2H9TBU5_9ZZZZ